MENVYKNNFIIYFFDGLINHLFVLYLESNNPDLSMF